MPGKTFISYHQLKLPIIFKVRGDMGKMERKPPERVAFLCLMVLPFLRVGLKSLQLGLTRRWSSKGL